LNKNCPQYKTVTNSILELKNAEAKLAITTHTLLELTASILTWNRVPFAVSPASLKEILQKLCQTYSVIGSSGLTIGQFLDIVTGSIQQTPSTGSFRKFKDRSEASILDDLWIAATAKGVNGNNDIHIITYNMKDYARVVPFQFSVWKPRIDNNNIVFENFDHWHQ